ncbi:MAG TPA: TadE family type IV pilus minor pilin [Cellulomonas sp.]
MAREAGSVSVELAIGMVTVVALLGLVLTLVAAGVAQIRCTDAARAGARAASLGGDDQAVAAVVTRSAGPAAEVTVSRDGTWVDVTVRVPVLGGRLLDDLVARSTAGLPAEP